MDRNKKKRIIIIAVYAVIFGLLTWFLYSALRPEETCKDGIKNQNEESVDCGGVCAPCKKIQTQPLLIKESGVVSSGTSGEYDFYGLIDNPNNTFGSNEFQYIVELKDSGGRVIAQRESSSFILPGDTKYVVETGIRSESQPTTAVFTITSTDWQEFNSYYQRPELEIVNRNYREITSGVGFAEATGLLKNRSPFDFSTMTIRIILKDPSGKVIALNSTKMNTVKSGEERDFRAFWPTRFPGASDFQNMETQVEVNVFSSDAFVKQYSVPQKFQQY